ncbi:hypothetical protein Tco_0086604 [Tanacetum coccineum]
MKVEDTSSKAMVAIDGAGFDWSYMVEKEFPTNMALMAFSDSEVYNDKTCSNTCLKSFKTLKTQYDNLRIELNKSKFDLATYKRSLASIEEQLVFYKKNEVMFTDQIAVLKIVSSFNESEITTHKMQIEKLKKDKEDNQIKIDNYENATKSLDKLIGSQIPNNSRKGVGYNAVPPPLTRLFAPPFVDLSNFGLEEFKQPKFEGYGPKANKCVNVDAVRILDLIRQNEYKNETKGLEFTASMLDLVSTIRCLLVLPEVEKTSDALIIEDWVSDSDEDESVANVLKSDNVQLKTEQANQPRNVSQIPSSVNHLIKSGTKTYVEQCAKGNWSEGTILTKSGTVPISTARQRIASPVSADRPINTGAPKSFVNVAKPRTNAFQKAHSPSRRPFY